MRVVCWRVSRESKIPCDLALDSHMFLPMQWTSGPTRGQGSPVEMEMVRDNTYGDCTAFRVEQSTWFVPLLVPPPQYVDPTFKRYRSLLAHVWECGLKIGVGVS